MEMSPVQLSDTETHAGLGIRLSSTCHQTLVAILMAYCSENDVLPRNHIERQMDWEGAQDFTGKKQYKKCLQLDIWGKRYCWLIMKKTATSVCAFSILGEHLYTHFPYFANKRHLLPELFVCILSHILLILVCLRKLIFCGESNPRIYLSSMSSVKNPKWLTQYKNLKISKHLILLQN